MSGWFKRSVPSALWGWFWIAVGAGLILVDQILEIVRLQVLGVHFPVGVLALIYGGMLVVYNRQRHKALHLTAEELSRHGGTLERVAPMIVDLLRRKVSVKEIARILERQEGLPSEVTYKYIIALGKEMLAQKAGSSEGD